MLESKSSNFQGVQENGKTAATGIVDSSSTAHTIFIESYSLVAQLEERQSVKLLVSGSIPLKGANFKSSKCISELLLARW